MRRDRIYIDDWNREDFAVVGVPEGTDGDEMRRWLKRQELAGECKLDFSTSHRVLHEDGRFYGDVAIISTHRRAPEEIACEAMIYHPDNADWASIGVPCASCGGRGCRDCGHTGVQGV